MITIYKDGSINAVHGVDLKAWTDEGWTLDPPIDLILALAKIDLNNADLTQLRTLSITVGNAKKLMDNRPLSPEKLGELGIEINPDLIYFGDYEKEKA